MSRLLASLLLFVVVFVVIDSVVEAEGNFNGLQMPAGASWEWLPMEEKRSRKLYGFQASRGKKSVLPAMGEDSLDMEKRARSFVAHRGKKSAGPVLDTDMLNDAYFGMEEN